MKNLMFYENERPFKAIVPNWTEFIDITYEEQLLEDIYDHWYEYLSDDWYWDYNSTDKDLREITYHRKLPGKAKNKFF